MAGICLTGIYSHLAQAANDDQTFNHQQQAIFDGVLDALEKAKIAIPTIIITAKKIITGKYFFVVSCMGIFSFYYVQGLLYSIRLFCSRGLFTT